MCPSQLEKNLFSFAAIFFTIRVSLLLLKAIIMPKLNLQLIRRVGRSTLAAAPGGVRFCPKDRLPRLAVRCWWFGGPYSHSCG